MHAVCISCKPIAVGNPILGNKVELERTWALRSFLIKLEGNHPWNLLRDISSVLYVYLPP